LGVRAGINEILVMSSGVISPSPKSLMESTPSPPPEHKCRRIPSDHDSMPRNVHPFMATNTSPNLCAHTFVMQNKDDPPLYGSLWLGFEYMVRTICDITRLDSYRCNHLPTQYANEWEFQLHQCRWEYVDQQYDYCVG
jgi:hypothetical protein